MRGESPRPTLKSIARVAGVTAATVSMALRGSPHISKATTTRVRKAAAALGYRPDPLLTKLMSHLRQGESRPVATLGMVTVREKPVARRETSYLRRYYDAALARGEELGFRIEELWLGAPHLTPQRMKDILLARGIEGLFVFSSARWKYINDFDFSPFACATYGRWTGSQRLMDRAVANHYLDLLRTVDELGKLGYRRPGLVIDGEVDEKTGELYTAAFLLAQHTGRVRENVPILTRPQIEERDFARWFKRHRPDAIIVHTPPSAVFLQWLGRLGIGVPADVGLVALDLDIDDPNQPSGIRQDSERIGAAVVDMIATKLQRNERGLPTRPQILLFEGEWVEGTTLRQTRS